MDTLCCLNIRESHPCAVAAAYRQWPDPTDRDILTRVNGKKHKNINWLYK